MWQFLFLAITRATLAANAQAQPDEAVLARAILNGYRRYSGICGHCHGPDGVGSSFGPSLVDAPLPWSEFQAVVMSGSTRGTSAMRGFADDPNVAPHVQDIYVYLRARASGAIGRGRPDLEP
jgi:mono/diheme cytochrome c family protein